MEIQGLEILLSDHDVTMATMGQAVVADPDFTDFVYALNIKLDRTIPSEVQMSGDGHDIHVLRIAYSKKVADALGAAIFAGVKMSAELEPDVRLVCATAQYDAAVNRARYAADARRRAKSRFRVVKND